ncbi:hypothetical protein [Streptomyces ortus]|uniref:Uncharacterized protein n=1 Tax=Streptomyces ortus TaxID=2867268 RepID=A0ABT3UWW1_9ACTN|nr:hypothetical protein [Streptomyces ortus]MCX4232049.1 hypothetical protein [Streptomyces ortus]
MSRKPRWSVTWPTRPNGVYTQLVRADNPTEAVRVAAEMDVVPNSNYALAFDYEPEVWRIRRPYRWLSHHIAGPDYGGAGADAETFVPIPLDTRQIAKQVLSAVRAGDARGRTVGQIVSWMRPEDVEAVLFYVAAEACGIDARTAAV